MWAAAAAVAARIIEFRGPFIPTSAVSFIEINYWAQTLPLADSTPLLQHGVRTAARSLARDGQTKGDMAAAVGGGRGLAM